jgi:hypothetical protein
MIPSIPSTVVVSRNRLRQNRPLGHPLSLFPPRLPRHRTILTSANLLLDGTIGTVKVSCSVTCLASTSAEPSNSGHRFSCNAWALDYANGDGNPGRRRGLSMGSGTSPNGLALPSSSPKGRRRQTRPAGSSRRSWLSPARTAQRERPTLIDRRSKVEQ